MDYVQSHDYFYEKAGPPVLKFALLPQRCAISGKLIWLKNGYFYIRSAQWHGVPLTDCRWHDVTEHIIWQLKR